MNTHPVTLIVTDDLRRTRLTVAFRIILAIPLVIWGAIWGIAAFFAVIANWFATLFAGRPPEGLHRFITRFLRYQTHTGAYFYLLADPYPSFMADRDYPVDLFAAPPRDQHRLVTLFRLILAIPLFVVTYVLGLLMNVLAIIAWFVALFTARVPEGLRNLLLFCFRFSTQTNGYLYILTDRYPSFAYETPDPEPVGATAAL